MLYIQETIKSSYVVNRSHNFSMNHVVLCALFLMHIQNEIHIIGRYRKRSLCALSVHIISHSLFRYNIPDVLSIFSNPFYVFDALFTIRHLSKLIVYNQSCIALTQNHVIIFFQMFTFYYVWYYSYCNLSITFSCNSFVIHL